MQDAGYRMQDSRCRIYDARSTMQAENFLHASCIMNHGSRIMHHASGRRAVSAVEYAVFIVVLILALLAMQFYLRRAMCGRLRNAGDVFGQGRQYEPGVTVVQ